MSTTVVLLLSATSLVLLVLFVRTGRRTARAIRKLDEELARGPAQTISLSTLLENVEADRERFLARAKKVFPRIYVRVVIFLFIATVMLLIMGLTSEADVPATDVSTFLIGAAVASAVAGLLVAAFLTVLRRGMIWVEYSKLMKLNVLPFLLQEQGSRLTYRAEGISEEQWKKALLYTSGLEVTSADRFTGQGPSGRPIEISEVLVEGRDSRSDAGDHKRVTRFRGLFATVDLPRSLADQPFQVVPAAFYLRGLSLPSVAHAVDRALTPDVGSVAGRRVLCDPVRKGDPVPIPGPLVEQYVALSAERDPAGKPRSHEPSGAHLERVSSQEFAERISRLASSSGRATVCFSVIGSRLNIGINIGRDLFEADAFLKTSFK